MEAPTVTDFSSDDQEEYTVIIDIGQATTKVGFAGDDEPKLFPTVCGKPKYKQMMAGVNVQEIYVGDDTTRMRGVLKLDYPINRGNVMNWDHYFAILNHIFYNVLRVDSSKCHVIYLVPPLTASDTSTYFASVLFQTHKCKSVAIMDTASTTAFSVGETTALSIELGTGLSTVTPIMNGQLYTPSIQRLNLAGMDIEDYLEKLLTTYGIFQKREIVKEIKEKSCRIAENIEIDSANASFADKFTLPDGEFLEINAYTATYAGEVLFQPQLLGVALQSLPQAVLQAVKTCDPYYWRILLKKIVFSGGTSNFNGLKKRLEREIELLLPQLGPLPAIVEDVVPVPEVTPVAVQNEEKPLKMVQATSEKSKAENCSKCGELIEDLESEFCPFCGEKVIISQINIMGSARTKFPTKCPKCKEKLDGESSFCPACGAKLEVIIVDEDKLKRKDKKLLKKTAADDSEMDEIAKMVEDEYGSEDDLEELAAVEPEKKSEEKGDPNRVVQIISTEGNAYASFKGASILGSLPTFKKFMITEEQYNANPNSVLVDFAKVVNPE